MTVFMRWETIQIYRSCEIGEDLQFAPTMKGMKYHVLFLSNWKTWSKVLTPNITVKIHAAANDGS
jgi:hypothetical protein